MNVIDLTDLMEEVDIDKNETLYSLWLDENKEYVPAVNLKTCEKIPSGAYKVVWKRDDWRVVPVPINTDELYIFSEDFTSKIMEESQTFWDRADIYKKYNFAHKRGLLLCGAPGCGKTAIITLLIKQLIAQDGLIFIVNNVKEFSFLTETLSPIIRKIEPNRPIITIIEDVDQLIENMNGNDAELLDFLDGKNSIEHHLVILTSNDTTDLSEALLRPSRIDMLYEIPNPNHQIRKEFFERKGVDPNKTEEFADATEGMSFAQLKEVFIGTNILGKPLDKVVEQVNTPFECKDYLSKQSNEIVGI